MIFENLPRLLFLKSRCEQSVFFRKFTDNLYRGPSRPKHSSSSSSSSSTSFFSLPREMYERKRENSRIIVHRSFFLFFSSRAIIIFRTSSGFRTGQPSSSQGKYRLPPPFRRENIDIRGGFFSLNPPLPPTGVRCFRSRVRRAEHTGGGRRWSCDVSASSKIREKPIRRGSASRM